MKLKAQTRFLQMTEAPTVADERTLTFPFSSEIPVERGYGTEILVHDERSMDVARLNNSAPLLFNHEIGDVLGVVEKAWVSPTDRRGYATVRFAKTARADEVLGMVRDRILPNVSFMYRIDDAVQAKNGDLRVTRFTPLEVSFVTIPADDSVGIGRQYANEETEVRLSTEVEPLVGTYSTTTTYLTSTSPAEPATTGRVIMADVITPAAGANADTDNKSAVQIEEDRQTAVRNLAQLMDIDERIWRRWIGDGTPVHEASDQAMKIKALRQKAQPITYLDAEVKEVRKYSVMRALRASATGDWSDAGLEREASQEVAKRLGRPAGKQAFFVPMDVQQRDLTVASASGGGYLKGTDNMSFIEILRNRMVVRAMGAQVMSGLVGDVTIPKQTVAATGYWLTDETTAITESQQTFGQLALTPRTVGALTQLSRKLMLQSSPSVEQLVFSDLGKVLAIAVDLAALAGTGTEQPTGIIQTASIGGFTGTSLAAAGLLDAQADVASANALSGSLGYVTTPTVAGLLMARPELPTSGTTRMWQGNMQDGSIFGLKAMSSNQMPAGDMIFGDWSQLVIAEWGVLELATSESANTADFHKGITTVRAFYSVDVGVRYAGAFSLATSIT